MFVAVPWYGTVQYNFVRLCVYYASMHSSALDYLIE